MLDMTGVFLCMARGHPGALPPNELRRRIIERLSMGPATTADLIDFAYGDDPDGGPLSAKQCITTTLFHLRKKGADIERKYTYSLVPRRPTAVLRTGKDRGKSNGYERRNG